MLPAAALLGGAATLREAAADVLQKGMSGLAEEPTLGCLAQPMQQLLAQATEDAASSPCDASLWLSDESGAGWSWQGSNIENGLLKALALPRRAAEEPPAAAVATPQPTSRRAAAAVGLQGDGSGLTPPAFTPSEAMPPSVWGEY